MLHPTLSVLSKKHTIGTAWTGRERHSALLMGDEPVHSLLWQYKALPCHGDKEGHAPSAVWLPAVPVAVMVSPGPKGVAVISSYDDAWISLPHWGWGHDYGRWIDDGWRRSDDDRKPDTHRDPHPCMGRERQGKSCKTEHSDNFDGTLGEGAGEELTCFRPLPILLPADAGQSGPSLPALAAQMVSSGKHLSREPLPPPHGDGGESHCTK